MGQPSKWWNVGYEKLGNILVHSLSNIITSAKSNFQVNGVSADPATVRTRPSYNPPETFLPEVLVSYIFYNIEHTDTWIKANLSWGSFRSKGHLILLSVCFIQNPSTQIVWDTSHWLLLIDETNFYEIIIDTQLHSTPKVTKLHDIEAYDFANEDVGILKVIFGQNDNRFICLIDQSLPGGWVQIGQLCVFDKPISGVAEQKVNVIPVFETGTIELDFEDQVSDDILFTFYIKSL